MLLVDASANAWSMLGQFSAKRVDSPRKRGWGTQGGPSASGRARPASLCAWSGEAANFACACSLAAGGQGARMGNARARALQRVGQSHRVCVCRVVRGVLLCGLALWVPVGMVACVAGASSSSREKRGVVARAGAVPAMRAGACRVRHIARARGAASSSRITCRIFRVTQKGSPHWELEHRADH